MRLHERLESKVDWRGWLLVGWVLWFGTLYVLMMLRERAPGLLRAIEGFLN